MPSTSAGDRRGRGPRAGAGGGKKKRKWMKVGSLAAAGSRLIEPAWARRSHRWNASASVRRFPARPCAQAPALGLKTFYLMVDPQFCRPRRTPGLVPGAAWRLPPCHRVRGLVWRETAGRRGWLPGLPRCCFSSLFLFASPEPASRPGNCFANAVSGRCWSASDGPCRRYGRVATGSVGHRWVTELDRPYCFAVFVFCRRSRGQRLVRALCAAPPP